jgi:uncharacterized surface protein with fasciclin (FAS1) repeats
MTGQLLPPRHSVGKRLPAAAVPQLRPAVPIPPALLHPPLPKFRISSRSTGCLQEERMRKFSLIAALALGSVAALGTSASAHNPMVGGAAMYPTRNIVQNAVNSKDHTTLVAAVKAAGLVDTLSGPGPFTVFAPTNEAFAKLPAGTVDTLLKPENKATLTKVLTYHVVPGRYTASQIASIAARNHGTATLKTVEGEKLRFMSSGGGWVVVDAKGGRARITIPNVMQSNGVIHVVDSVLMP